MLSSTSFFAGVVLAALTLNNVASASPLGTRPIPASSSPISADLEATESVFQFPNDGTTFVIPSSSVIGSAFLPVPSSRGCGGSGFPSGGPRPTAFTSFGGPRPTAPSGFGGPRPTAFPPSGALRPSNVISKGTRTLTLTSVPSGSVISSFPVDPSCEPEVPSISTSFGGPRPTFEPSGFSFSVPQPTNFPSGSASFDPEPTVFAEDF
ncbi:hypothetical protein FA15DRAFT_753656 [Coprinopsis marcescibilis]|uniref:Uncharacterized protein n=1 Tax=Coprinopsis marcescibilis TaxID=230819 RepID=A0A5C3L5M9_COPMA|nr:hypothetical protein FA15DRAFT_753656 [Coprinopsis marcescibilis]